MKNCYCSLEGFERLKELTGGGDKTRETILVNVFFLHSWSHFLWNFAEAFCAVTSSFKANLQLTLNMISLSSNQNIIITKKHPSSTTDSAPYFLERGF